MAFQIHAVMQDSDDLNVARPFAIDNQMTAHVKLAISLGNLIASKSCEGITGQGVKTPVRLRLAYSMYEHLPLRVTSLSFSSILSTSLR